MKRTSSRRRFAVAGKARRPCVVRTSGWPAKACEPRHSRHVGTREMLSEALRHRDASSGAAAADQSKARGKRTGRPRAMHDDDTHPAPRRRQAWDARQRCPRCRPAQDWAHPSGHLPRRPTRPIGWMRSEHKLSKPCRLAICVFAASRAVGALRLRGNGIKGVHGSHVTDVLPTTLY